MRLPSTAVVLALLVGLMCWAQDKQKSIPLECAKTIRAKGSIEVGSYRILPNESYKHPPTVKFSIEENGTVSDVKVTRSSGVADIDKKVVDSIGKWKFKPRPNGCGVIDSEGTVLIHWGTDSH